jgi:hypothetical protein
VQAKLSLAASLIAAIGLAGMIFLILRNYQAELGAIVFAKKSIYGMAFLGACAATMLLSVIGLALGISSAGQRRNEFQRRSWTGFFLGTAVLAGAIISFVMFWSLQLPQ